MPGVGVLSFALIALPYTAHAATLTSGRPGAYGRHAETILAYLVDHLGTIRGAVNQAGVVVETRDYAPFGESIAHTGAFSVQHRFTGQPQDDQAGGLYNYGARFYNPKWGRFISPDELVQGFDSQGLNPFTYVLDQPTSLVDPDGHLVQTLPALVILTIAFLPVLYFVPQAAQDLARAVEEVTGRDSSDADEGSSGAREGAGRNEPHGDGGRAKTKAEKAIKDIKTEIKRLKGEPGSSREIKQLKKKAVKIADAAAKAAKGEMYHR